MAQIPHPSSTSSLPSDRLHTPVVYSKKKKKKLHFCNLPVKDSIFFTFRMKKETLNTKCGRSSHVLLRAAGNPQAAQRLFWRWKLRRPHLTQRVWVLFLLLPKLPVPFPCRFCTNYQLLPTYRSRRIIIQETVEKEIESTIEADTDAETLAALEVEVFCPNNNLRRGWQAL